MNKPIHNILRGTTAAAVCLTATFAGASSHREAPAITQTPKIDGTDFYMFRSYEPGRDAYVTLIANYQPIQAPYGGPNYFTMDEDAIYEIHIDNNGDAIEDLTFQFQFDNNLKNDTGIKLNVAGESVAIPLRQAGQITAGSPSAALNESESYTVTMITGDRRTGARASLTTSSGSATFIKPVDYIGTKTLPDYDAYASRYIYNNVDIPNCSVDGRVFAGQRAEAFAVNLGQIFDLVNVSGGPIQGPANPMWPQYGSGPGPVVQDRANDELIGTSNVTSLALEIPIACLTQGSDPVIGAWTTSSLPQAELEDPSPTYEQASLYGGAWVQQSRLSAPLVNEVVIGLPDKNLFNAAEPRQDSALAVYVTNPTLPVLIETLFPSAPAPSNYPRTDLVAAFLTGFPNLNQPANFDAKNASEMMRLNTAVAPTAAGSQSTFGVAGGDIAGFPNGRRPGDDVVDIALRVVMGRLCYDLPIGSGGAGVNLGYCSPSDAPAGDVPFTDGAPLNASDVQSVFPYLNTPIPGAT